MNGESDEQVNFGDLISGFSFDSERIRKRGKKKAQRAPEPVPEQPDQYATLPFEPVPPLPSIELSTRSPATFTSWPALIARFNRATSSASAARSRVRDCGQRRISRR